MLFYTHLLLGICVFLLWKGNPLDNILLFFILLLGAILPDIDEIHSKINRWSGIIGSIIAFFSKHRGMFHSLLFALLFSALLGWLWQFQFGLALFLGYLSHLFGDALTPMGLAIFYPFSQFRIKGPIRTGSIWEFLIMIGLAVLIVKEMI